MEKVIEFIKGIMQPLLTAVAIILFLSMSLSGAFPASDVFKVIVGIILFWFGYTGIKNFTYTPSKPEAGGGSAEPPLASNVGNSITNDTTVEPESDTTEEEEIIIPFDKEDFIKEVAETDPVQDYTVDTATTRFYESKDRILIRWLNDGRIQNNQALLDAWRTIRDYAEKSFREIWEIMDDTVPPLVWVDQNYDELKKCTTCKPVSTFHDLKWLALMKGEKYYISYLNLTDTYDNINTWADDVHQRGIKEL